MKKIKFLATVGLAVLELGAFSVFGGIDVQAAVPASYEYVGQLDISSKGWKTYNTGSNRDMVGNSLGELKNGSTLYVLNEAKNSKGNLVAMIYSPDLNTTCYVSSRYIKQVSDEAVEESVEDERAAIVDATSHESVSKMVEGIFIIRSKVNEEQCLDVKDFNNQSGAKAQTWYNTGASNQIFRITKDKEGYWKIQSLYSGKFLEAKKLFKKFSGAEFNDESGSKYQQFIIEYDEEDACFKIINRATGYALHVDGDKDGSNVYFLPKGEDAAQDFVFCNVFVNDDSVYEKQRQYNTCTLASATNMIRKKLEIRGQEYSHCTEKAMRKIAWSTNGGLYNSFKYDDMYITHCNISSMTDEEKAEYLKATLLEHPEGVVIYSKYNLPAGERAHACLLVDVDYDPISDSDKFLVYDPSSATPDHLIDLEECTLKTKTTKMGAIDILWYISH